MSGWTVGLGIPRIDGFYPLTSWKALILCDPLKQSEMKDPLAIMRAALSLPLELCFLSIIDFKISLFCPISHYLYGSRDGCASTVTPLFFMKACTTGPQNSWSALNLQGSPCLRNQVHSNTSVIVDAERDCTIARLP